MALSVEIVTGPSTDKVSKEQAESALRAHPAFPKNASVALEPVEGRWIAAIANDDSLTKEAAPPFGGGDETPSGPPAPEGPPSDGPAPDDGAGSDNTDGEDKPSEEPKGDEKPGEEKGEKGLEAQVHHLTELLTRVVDALGLGDPAGANPVPGADDPHVVPPGPGGPEDGIPGEHADPEGKTHTIHERAMKPGETQPGGTPIGAPAFASVSEDHPWRAVVGKKRTFELQEPIGDGEKLSDIRKEILALAEGTGYKIAQLVPSNDTNGRRIARVLMERPLTS